MHQAQPGLPGAPSVRPGGATWRESMTHEEADRSPTGELALSPANRACREVVLAGDWKRAEAIAAHPPANTPIADLQSWWLRRQSLANRQWESFLVCYGEKPNVRNVVLRAPTVIEARNCSAQCRSHDPVALCIRSAGHNRR